MLLYMEHIAIISSKGQITLPADIRKSLNIRPGDRLSIVKKARYVAIVPDTFEQELAELRSLAKQHLARKGLTNLPLDEIKRRADAAKQDALKAKHVRA
jgi:AbrB family looped-hinge helix DNA binding protein